MSWNPDCFDSEEQYDLWLDFYVESKGYETQPEDLSLFCADCSLAYYNKMNKENRCMFKNRIRFTEYGGYLKEDAREIPIEEREENTN